MKEYYSLFINNEWVDASDKGTFEVTNPCTGEKLAEAAAAAPEDVDRAVKAARAAFDTGSWPGMSALEKSRILKRCADGLRNRLDEFARLESMDVGKPIRESRDFDIPMTADCFEYYANLLVSIHGHSIPAGPGILDYTEKEPIGVIGAIAPWNFPLALAVRKIAPAIAAGNTVVMKPSSLAPLTSILLGEVLKEAGLPAGVVNIIPGSGQVVGDGICNHPLVDKLSFTGSTDTGIKVMQNAACCIRSTSLELGGKSPAIVLKDADLDVAVKGVLFGAFLNQGECCCAAARVLIDRSVHEAFMKQLVAETQAIRLGPSLEETTQMGPLISEEHRKNVMRYIQKGLTEGAVLACGGTIPNEPGLARGYYLSPTIFDRVSPQMTIYREEIFGPVLTVSCFDTEEELIAAANDTKYGLAASIFTRNLQKGHLLARRIKAGTVWINIHNFVFSQAPYGGYKQSGLGRELGLEGLEAYMETKNIIVYLDQAPFQWY